MDVAGARRVTDRLKDEVETLRTVAVGDTESQEYELLFMREDIGRLYPEETRDEIFRDALLERIAERKQEELFDPLGSIEFTVRVFEGGINLLVWGEEDAMFVGFGPEEADIPLVTDICRDFVDGS
ncbi:MAG: hypothetical protein ACLFMT_01210 [Halobacteriales archaeon]